MTFWFAAPIVFVLIGMVLVCASLLFRGSHLLITFTHTYATQIHYAAILKYGTSTQKFRLFFHN